MACFVAATAAALVVERMAPAKAVAAIEVVVIWVMFYPVARMRESDPWWAHWARGFTILAAFLFAKLPAIETLDLGWSYRL
jgi:hypothetical protein